MHYVDFDKAWYISGWFCVPRILIIVGMKWLMDEIKLNETSAIVIDAFPYSYYLRYDSEIECYFPVKIILEFWGVY